MRSDALQGKMQLVSVSSCRPCDGCPSSAEGGFEGRNLSAPSGHLPFQGRLLGAGATCRFCAGNFCCSHMTEATRRSGGCIRSADGMPWSGTEGMPGCVPPGRLRSRQRLGALMGSGGQP